MTDISLRSGAGHDNQRLLVAATCVAITSLVPIALYQSKVIPNLPDPPLRIFDSERITTSSTAHPLGFPDACLGLASFGTTLALVLLARRNPRIRPLLGLKLALDASVGAFNMVRQIVEFRKLCSWCSATALLTTVMAYAGRCSMKEAACAGLSLASCNRPAPGKLGKIRR